MYKIFSLAGVAAALFILNKTGENEPDWLPAAVIMLLTYMFVLVSYGFQVTINRRPICPEQDEHRDNAVG